MYGRKKQEATPNMKAVDITLYCSNIQERREEGIYKKLVFVEEHNKV